MHWNQDWRRTAQSSIEQVECGLWVSARSGFPGDTALTPLYSGEEWQRILPRSP